jgi:hypothetical protein
VYCFLKCKIFIDDSRLQPLPTGYWVTHDIQLFLEGEGYDTYGMLLMNHI